MFVVVCAQDPEWAAPLSAMLRERGFDVVEAIDLVDALAAVRGEGAIGLVVNTDIGEPEAAAALRAVARRFGDSIRRVGVGARPDDPGIADAWVDNAYRYVAVVAALGAPPARSGERTSAGDVIDRIVSASGLLDRKEASAPQRPTSASGRAVPAAISQQAVTPSRPYPAASDPPALSAEPPAAHAALGPVTLAEVHRLLQVARFEPYHELLAVAEDAHVDQVDAAAAALLDRLDDEKVPAHVADAAFAELSELRAAIDDAGAGSPRRQRALLRRAPVGAAPSSSDEDAL